MILSGALLLPLAALYAVLVPSVSGLRFFLGPHERACFGLSARGGALLHGLAHMENGRGEALLAVEISGPDGVIFERHAQAIGKFSVTTPKVKDSYSADPGDWEMEDDDFHAAAAADIKYKACLVLTLKEGSDPDHKARRAVSFRLYQADDGEIGSSLAGVGGKASSEKVDNMAMSLRQMMSDMQGIVGDLTALQRREHSLVRRQREDARRLSYLGATSILVLVATSFLQFAHYRQFFSSKKLC